MNLILKYPYLQITSLAILLLVISCNKKDDCGHIPSCCLDRYTGSLSLSDESRELMPVDSLLYFTDNQGGRVTFYRSESGRKYFQNVIRTIDTTCKCVSARCFEYFGFEQEHFLYRSDGVPVELAFRRVVQRDNQEGDSIKGHDEAGIIIMGSQALSFVLPYNTNTSNAHTFYNSLTIREKEYKDVYQIHRDSSGIETAPPNAPSGIYFSKKDGLIGFYQVNGALWAKE